MSTTCVDDFTARFGCHACTETVAAFADEVARLKGAFHRSVSIGLFLAQILMKGFEGVYTFEAQSLGRSGGLVN